LDILTEFLLPLPEGARPFFRLTFYESTPAHYQPLGYYSVSAPYRFKQAGPPQRTSSLIFETNCLSCSVYISSLFFTVATEELDQVGVIEEEEHREKQLGKLQLKERAASEIPKAPRYSCIISKCFQQ
uniref:HORMA domain-containing protein n=1 Tax=Gongylonema pulchrum TaxID=637853 RepID=A0A183DBB3_9BILA